jgi:hypothetical protein
MRVRWVGSFSLLCEGLGTHPAAGLETLLFSMCNLAPLRDAKVRVFYAAVVLLLFNCEPGLFIINMRAMRIVLKLHVAKGH